MKRINSIFELFVLVIFCELSVASPPMLSGCSSSSSSVVKQLEPCIYGLESLARGNPPGNRTWRRNPRIYIEDNKYKLLGANNELAFKNTTRNTNLFLFFEKKIIIRAIDNSEVLYHLDFERASEAGIVADYFLPADSTRYKKCTGSNTYKLEKLYKHATATTPARREDNLCIFKVRQGATTAFVIRRMAPADNQSLTLCLFHAIAYELNDLRDENQDKKLELRVYAPNELIQPIYVLETSKPAKLQEFFGST